MSLEDYKFKEKKVVSPANTMLHLALLLMLAGTIMNFHAVMDNGGRMPVWNTTIPFNTETHFTITDINEIEHLHLVDIYHFGGNVWSLGDFTIIAGFVLGFTSIGIVLYQSLINLAIKSRELKK